MKWTKRKKVTFFTDCNKIPAIPVRSSRDVRTFHETGDPAEHAFEGAEAATPPSLVSW
ncbi:MAG: hypothetical protein ACI8W3_003737 [Myxococcota bacterium]|jgi:hypothetical protein